MGLLLLMYDDFNHSQPSDSLVSEVPLLHSHWSSLPLFPSVFPFFILTGLPFLHPFSTTCHNTQTNSKTCTLSVDTALNVTALLRNLEQWHILDLLDAVGVWANFRMSQLYVFWPTLCVLTNFRCWLSLRVHIRRNRNFWSGLTTLTHFYN